MHTVIRNKLTNQLNDLTALGSNEVVHPEGDWLVVYVCNSVEFFYVKSFNTETEAVEYCSSLNGGVT